MVCLGLIVSFFHSVSFLCSYYYKFLPPHFLIPLVGENISFIQKVAFYIGEGNGNPLQYSCLKNPLDGGAWWAAIYGVAQSRTRLKRLSSSSSSSLLYGFSWWLRSKESAYNAGDFSLIPGSGRSPGEGNGSPLQCSCLGNSMDRGSWWAIVHEVAKESDMTL